MKFVTFSGKKNSTQNPSAILSRDVPTPGVLVGEEIVDLTGLAFMDCYSLNEFMAARAQARRAGGDLVLAAPHPAVLRLLVLCDVASRGLVFTSVDEAVSGAGSALAAPVMPGAEAIPSSPARSGIVSSALCRGGAAMSYASRLPGLITAVSRKRLDGAGTRQDRTAARRTP